MLFSYGGTFHSTTYSIKCGTKSQAGFFQRTANLEFPRSFLCDVLPSTPQNKEIQYTKFYQGLAVFTPLNWTRGLLAGAGHQLHTSWWHYRIFIFCKLKHFFTYRKIAAEFCLSFSLFYFQTGRKVVPTKSMKISGINGQISFRF